MRNHTKRKWTKRHWCANSRLFIQTSCKHVPSWHLYETIHHFNSFAFVSLNLRDLKSNYKNGSNFRISAFKRVFHCAVFWQMFTETSCRISLLSSVESKVGNLVVLIFFAAKLSFVDIIVMPYINRC